VSKPELPLGDGSVPDKALEELLAAFAGDSNSESEVDVDDPSIDLLLGMENGASAGEPPVTAPNPVTAKNPTTAPNPATAKNPATVDPQDLPTIEQPETKPETPLEPTTAEPAPRGADSKPVSKVPRKPIRIGGDDDLPDAVYLDEEGEERLRGTSGRATEASIREERRTILIGGDEVEGSSGGIPIGTGAAMDPRLRARRIAVSRAASRRRLKWVLIPVVAILIVVAGLGVLGSSLFAVRSVEVSGQVYTSPADVDAAVKQLKGKPVLLIDTHAIESRLEKSPWVREARVSTDFPHGASIEIREREPLATYQGTDNRFRIIDVEGRVVDVLAGQPIEFMLITGPAVNAEAGGSAGVAFTHGAELVEALTPGVRSRTASVGVSEAGELSLHFHNDPETVVLLGAPTQLLDKLTRLEALLKNTDVNKCSRIDVSTAELGPTCST
jgi:cell division septal protein FtsQ